jgi:uncharacterized protein (TIGR02118 family)
MTVKLVILYTQPEDARAFDEHYLAVHGPLVDAIPGLLRWESSRFVSAADGAELTYHRIAELYFADMESLQEALATDESSATAQDYGRIAPPGSRRFVAAVD